jgi:hypothetical protein
VNGDGTLASRVRQIAEDVAADRSFDGGTHSDACWQWHTACALYRAADELQRREARDLYYAEVIAQTCTEDQLCDISNEMDEWERHQ